jgi:hypothetical protein
MPFPAFIHCPSALDRVTSSRRFYELVDSTTCAMLRLQCESQYSLPVGPHALRAPQHHVLEMMMSHRSFDYLQCCKKLTANFFFCIALTRLV